MIFYSLLCLLFHHYRYRWFPFLLLPTAIGAGSYSLLVNLGQSTPLPSSRPGFILPLVKRVIQGVVVIFLEINNIYVFNFVMIA